MATPAREIPQRELRNHVGEVLREVEQGATLRVTVRGRPVADLVPVEEERVPRFASRLSIERLLARARPDAGFGRDIDAALPETIDELE